MPVVNGNEIQTGVTTRGNFTIQYQQNGNGGVIPIIDGTPNPELLMGYTSEEDKQAGLELLAEALEATNGDIMGAMSYMYSAVRTAAEGIVPQKAVDVNGTEILINFEEAFLQGTGGTTNPSTFVEDVDIDDESDQNWWGN